VSGGPATGRRGHSGWDQIFDVGDTVLWTGAPDRTRLVMTRYGLAGLMLVVAGLMFERGGLWFAAALIAAFFAVRGFWLALFRIGETHYAISTRHVAIRRLGHRSGWLKYPLTEVFLQEDLGLIRVFALPHCHPRPPAPIARLWHLCAPDRAAALRAAGQVPHRRFHIARQRIDGDLSSVLPDLLRRAGVETSQPLPILWQGRPLAAPMVMPWMVPAAAAILLFAGAIVAAVTGHAGAALWAGAGSVTAMAVEVGGFRWQQRRELALRYAVAGRYAIRIGPGLPCLTALCDIRRISCHSPIAADATDLTYAAEAYLVRGGWASGRVTFHRPSDPVAVEHLLRRLSAGDGDAMDRAPGRDGSPT